VIAEPPLSVGAVHDADQFKLVPLSEEDAVSELTVPGTVGDNTVALLENACVDPPAFVAVTRQRIGLVKKEKKLGGGAYVELVWPDMFKNVAPWSLYCH
jgi:hypothetical protein